MTNTRRSLQRKLAAINLIKKFHKHNYLLFVFYYVKKHKFIHFLFTTTTCFQKRDFSVQIQLLFFGTKQENK